MSISGSIVPARLPGPRQEAGLARSAADLNLEHAQFMHSTSALGGRVVDLMSRRRALSEAVERFLSDWHGDAAEAFAIEWSVWRDGADAVIDDLRHSVGALRRTHQDLAGADTAISNDTPRRSSRPNGPTGVTACEVDIDELQSIVTQLAACQRAMVDLGLDIQAEHDSLHQEWLGQPSTPHTAHCGAWRHHLAEMVTSLAVLRSLGDTVTARYEGAMDTDIALWERAR